MSNHVTSNKKIDHPIRNKIGGVFVHVSNMERSVNWYHRLLGMPDRTAATEKVHEITMDGGSSFVLDQNGYDSGLTSAERALLMLDSPDVGAACRFVKQSGIEIVEDIMQFPGMAFFTFRDPDGNLLMVCGNPGSIDETENQMKDKMAETNVRYDAGGLWLTASEQAAVANPTSSGFELTGHAYADEKFETPLRIETTVRIERGSLYLTYGEGMAALNFGNSTDVQENGTGSDLFVVHPKLNKHFTFQGKGAIPLGQWARAAWTIDERSMVIHVDGKLFHRQEGYFGNYNGRVGIAGVMGQVTVKSFAVESLAADQRSACLPIAGSAAEEDQLIADASCHAVASNNGLWLSSGEAGGFARTGSVYKVPFTFKAELHSYTRSASLYGGYTAYVRWNSDGNLLFIDPATGEEVWIEDAALPYESPSHIEWKLDKEKTTITIDGKTVLHRKGSYGNISFKLGIGADTGSAVTVKSVIIDNE